MYVMNIQYIDKSQSVHFISDVLKKNTSLIFTSDTPESEKMINSVIDSIEEPQSITHSFTFKVSSFEKILDYLIDNENQKIETIVIYDLKMDEEDMGFLATSQQISSMNLYILK